jgi:hypothetical protein
VNREKSQEIIIVVLLYFLKFFEKNEVQDLEEYNILPYVKISCINGYKKYLKLVDKRGIIGTIEMVRKLKFFN